jgi:hypothetical protein
MFRKAKRGKGMDSERKEIEHVTRIFGSGYGLPMLIWGSIGLFPPVWGFLVTPLLLSFNISQSAIDTACLWALFVLIGLAIYLTVVSIRFYRGSYGRVRIGRTEMVRMELKHCLYVIPALIGFTAGVWIDRNLQPPVSVSFLCFAGFSFVLWFVKGRGFSVHHLWLGLIILLLSLFPLLDLQQVDVYSFTLTDYYVVLSGIFGLIVATDGLFDHLMLMRTLKPLPSEEENHGFV